MYGGSNLWGDNPSQKKCKKAAKSAKKDKDREFSSSSMSSMDLSFAIQGGQCGSGWCGLVVEWLVWLSGCVVEWLVWLSGWCGYVVM